MGEGIVIVGTKGMTDQQHYEQQHYVEQQRPIPVSTFQAGAQAVGDVTSGLRRTPLMLGVIVLNIAGILSAVYFLNVLIQGQQVHMTEVINAEDKQFKTLIEMHNREFDALLDLSKKVEIAVPSPPQSTPPPGGRK